MNIIISPIHKTLFAGRLWMGLDIEEIRNNKKIIIVLVAAIAFQFGIEALVWSSVFTSIISIVLNAYSTHKLIEYSIIGQFKDISISLFLSLGMFAIIHIILNLIDLNGLFIKILIPSVAGFLFYIVTIFFLKTDALKLVLEFKRD